MAEIPFEPYTGQGKFRFWCQKVLPLVYDDSLSYYELLGKVVEYLNNTIKDVSACEDNITALRDAFVQLQDYVNEQLEDFAPEVERIIDEMVDSGEFGEILSDVVNGLIASEYDETTQYLQFAYCLKDGKLYCATASTTGTWDETKWRETTVGDDMQLLSRRLYNLNAGQVSYDNTATYDNGTVGKKLKDLDNFDTNLNAGQVGYNSESTYNNATVGKELQELKGSINSINAEVTDDSPAAVNGIYFRYRIRHNILYYAFFGTPTSTDLLEVTIPRALAIALNVSTPQWGDAANIMQVYGDANQNWIRVRNFTINKSVNVSGVVPLVIS